MAIEKFDETKIPANWVQGLEKSDGLVLNESFAWKVADVMFTGTTLALDAAKKKDRPVAFIYDELSGNFIMGAVVEYHEGKDKKDPGNWSYIWTFSKEDIPDTAEILRPSDSVTIPYFRSVSVDKYKFSIDNEYIAAMLIYLGKVISKWLQDNAVENDIVGIELDGVFQARAAVEKGEVVKSIEVIGDTKLLIKDDAAIEK